MNNNITVNVNVMVNRREVLKMAAKVLIDAARKEPDDLLSKKYTEAIRLLDEVRNAFLWEEHPLKDISETNTLDILKR